MLHILTDINFYIALSISVLNAASIIFGCQSYERYLGKSPTLRRLDAHPVARSLATAAFICILCAVSWSVLPAKAARNPIYVPVVAASGFAIGFVGMMSWLGAALRALMSRDAYNGTARGSA